MLQVNYFNEVHAVWEPLIERLDGGARRWNLDLEVIVSLCSMRIPSLFTRSRIFATVSLCSRHFRGVLRNQTEVVLQ